LVSQGKEQALLLAAVESLLFVGAQIEQLVQKTAFAPAQIKPFHLQGACGLPQVVEILAVKRDFQEIASVHQRVQSFV
jgi:glycine cleavage system regulatory protein